MTYVVAYETFSDVFPTKRPLLHGHVSHLLAYQYAASTIVKHISAVVTRNKDYGHDVLGCGDLRRYTDGGSNHTRLRDACMIMVGAMCAVRVIR